MKIPSEIRIAGVDYQTIIVESLDDGMHALCGQIDYGKSVISLCPRERYSHQAQCKTYLHEVLHGIAFHYGLELPSEKEEEIIDKFAGGLYQVLQDNARKFFDIEPVPPTGDE